MFSHVGSVIPSFNANYRSHDENEYFLYEWLPINWWEITKKTFEYGHDYNGHADVLVLFKSYFVFYKVPIC